MICNYNKNSQYTRSNFTSINYLCPLPIIYIGSTTSSTSNNIGPNHGGNHFKEPNIPFRDWDLESVCAWMEHLLGLQSYAVGMKYALKIYD